MRVLPASREILRVLGICPWIPIDVLSALIGARSRANVYQALARLAAAGLVQRRPAQLGLLGGRGPTALWATTRCGVDALRMLPGESLRAFPTERRLVVPARTRTDDPVRVAAARALAGWLVAQRATG